LEKYRTIKNPHTPFFGTKKNTRLGGNIGNHGVFVGFVGRRWENAFNKDNKKKAWAGNSTMKGEGIDLAPEGGKRLWNNKAL